MFSRARVARAIYQGILGREPSESESANLARHLKAANLGLVFQDFLDSQEFRNRALRASLPAWTLPDLKTIVPHYFGEETTDYAEIVSVFRAEQDSDFDLLESMIHTHRYYDVPNVWGLQIDLDKKTTAAIARGLGGKRCLELGCFTGAALSVLAAGGSDVTGLDMSHLAFTFAYPNVRDRMVYGDLLSADLPGGYDVILAMDFFEHLNPTRLGAYFERVESLLADDGYVYLNSPMYGADDVFGLVFPLYLKEWMAIEDRSFWRHLDCDKLGWPKHGHLVWAMASWWERSFRAAGLVRDRTVEAALHRRLAGFFELAPGRRCLFVLRKNSNRRDSERVSNEVVRAIDGIDEPI